MGLPSRLRSALLLSLATLACRDERGRVPPSANFLIAAGDSTFWVRSGREGVRIRRSPILLTRYDGRFHEVYVADDDRSYYDAVFVGQRVYRRDLLSGDSVSVFHDPTVPAIADAYAVSHPGDRRLEPSEEASDSPHAVATSETEILDVFGPFLTYEHHTDIDIQSGTDSHSTRRGVIDLARARQATLASMFGDAVAARLTTAGRRAFALAIDSVRATRGESGRRAAAAIDAFAFDSASFDLADDGGQPVVSFVVPGSGDRAGGLSLSLPPIAVDGGTWWRDVRALLPIETDEDDRDVWRGAGYDVLARYDSTGERVELVLRDGARHEFRLGPMPAPARRVYRLDDPPLDSLTLRALARAFDESVLYSEDARTALAPPRGAHVVQAVATPSNARRTGRGAAGASRRRQRASAPATIAILQSPTR